jgi:AcrR family transcriptional regulator
MAKATPKKRQRSDVPPTQHDRGGAPPKPRRSGDSPKQSYHHGDLKEALIEAGEAVLNDRGLQGFTLRECARRAGVSHAAPKHHFGDVRGLLTEIAARGFAELTRRLRTKLRAAGSDLGAQFIATSEAYLGFAEAHPEHFRVMFRSDLLDVCSPSLIEAARETFTELTNVIRRQRGEPDIDVASLDSCMTSTDIIDDILLGWCYVHGFAHLKLEGQLAMAPKSVLKNAANAAARRLSVSIRRV